MNLILGAFLIALFHALLPTHWASFVFVGKAQGWSRQKILTVALMAGASHVIMTILLGILVVGVGIGLAQVIGEWIHPLAGGILILFGILFLISHLKHRRHVEKAFEDHWATLSLVAFLTFSPCETLLPIFFAASSMGWGTVIPLCFLIGFTTLGTMLLMTFLLSKGLEAARFQILEDYESLISGVITILLGIFVLFIH
jgi:putative Mn2+ efflux pump MntP